MSINMFLPEVQQQTESVEKLCQSYISGMEEVKKSIAAFSMEFRLKGKTYDSAKTYFAKTYLPLAEGIILLSEAVIRAHQQLPERYITEVDSNSLQSDVLEDQILRFESSIQSLETIQKAVPLTVLSTAGAIASLRFLQSRVKDKLNRLITFHGNSAQIFSEVDQLLADVEAGLAEVSSGRAWSEAHGSFNTDKLDLSWAENIKAKKFESDLKKEVEPILNKLDSESKKALNKEYEKFKNGEMSPEEFAAILAGYKQKSISWEGEKGGYEVEEIWLINLEINRLKIEQEYAEKQGDQKAKEKALKQEEALRAKYSHLNDYLIDINDKPHDLPSEYLQLEDGSILEYRVDNEGYLHYKVEPGYEYYEETHKQTKAQRYHGIVGKGVAVALATRGAGLLTDVTISTAGAGAIGGVTSLGSELLEEARLPGVYIPKVDEVKTMIYRTNIETGQIEILIIDSQGREIVSHSEWKKYN